MRPGSGDRTRPPSQSIGWHGTKSTRMIDRVAGNRPLPANIRQDIVERTDGIPLFVEEMTKAVLEAEGESEARRMACRHTVFQLWRCRQACMRR